SKIASGLILCRKEEKHMKILVVEPNKAPHGTDIPSTLANMQAIVAKSKYNHLDNRTKCL
ncbi:MAG: hypothetical protein Q3Y08_00420, partial [Butyricicoccus sp.]|nr:hypothetical protein [Butyricicoccus sp.]